MSKDSPEKHTHAPSWVEWAYAHRRVVVLALTLGLLTIAYGTAYLIRFEFQVPSPQLRLFWATLPLLLAIKVVVFKYYHLYSGLWRYVSVDDLERILKAAVVSSVVFFACTFLWPLAGSVPRSVILLDLLLTVAMIGGTRFAVRVFREEYHPQRPEEVGESKRVIVVGAGAAGVQTIREIRSNPSVEMEIVGLVDDDPRKVGATIQGLRILGPTEELGSLVQEYAVDEVLIAIPSATGKQLRDIVELAEDDERIRFKVLPAVGDLIAGRVSIQQFREVEIEDLLGREHIRLDIDSIAHEIAGKTVLVTGAGGSIGSELARQIQGYGPERLVLLDRNENGLFHVNRELQAREQTDPDRIVPAVGDVCDTGLLEELFEKHNIGIVYHAAAFKHVPLMEDSVVEALRNNVLGSYRLMEAARSHGVDRFVFISTDKAVRPRNVMGASKRMAEMVLLDQHPRGETKFVAVRFGNVLGSDGSVLPIFREQLKSGGPLTVTDPEVSRYFMTIPEAVQLVIQAGVMGKGGEIFMLDMGDPVKIVELAERLVTLSGQRPYEDIQIVFTGLRPGEKLHEDLYAPEEPILPTMHEKILVLGGTANAAIDLETTLRILEDCLAERDVERARAILFKSVSESWMGESGPGSKRASSRRASS